MKTISPKYIVTSDIDKDTYKYSRRSSRMLYFHSRHK